MSKKQRIINQLKKQGLNAQPNSSKDQIGALEKIERMRGIIPKVIAWWTVGELVLNILSRIYEFLNQPAPQVTTSFCVEEGTQEYLAITSMASIYLDKTRSSNAIFKLEKTDADGEKSFKPMSDCVLLFDGHYVTIERSSSDSPVSKIHTSVWIVHIPVVILDKFLQEFERYVELSGKVSDGIYRWNGWSWGRIASIPSNRVVILPKGQMESVINDAKRFLSAKKWYFEKGIPWRRGYEFFGLPGTGKTSLAICMAINLKKSLYCISSRDCSSSVFERALRDLPTGAIVLIEDVDCIFDEPMKNRAASADSLNDPTSPDDTSDGMTLSSFLNAIDGVSSQKDGRILIITTNHNERLDPAIVRPGRIDVKIEFKHADKYQLELLCKRVLGEKDGALYYRRNFKNRRTPVTMAEAENMLLPVALDQIEKLQGG